jgi:sugar transferase (PEP-CTERM/EpsH1 system associated)
MPIEKTQSLSILFVSATVPYPAIDGGRIRVLSLVSNLCKNNKVTFLTFIKSPEDMRGAQYLRDMGIEVVEVKWYYDKALDALLSVLKQIISGKPLTIAKYYSPAMADKLEDLLKNRSFDILHFEMLHTGQYILRIPNEYTAKRILDQQNIDSCIWQRLASTEHNPFKKLLYHWQYRAFSRFENKLCPIFNECVCVSKEDGDRLASICPGANIEFVPNGVDVDYFCPIETKENESSIVFVGSMDWQPNEDAVLYFCDSILPLIKPEIPDVKFYIVGSNPTDRVLKLKSMDGVVVTGLVDDVRPYMVESAVYVVPLRIGGGTRLKILQAFAMKKAVISTSVGCEGLGLVHGEHILISDNPKEFADNVIKLARDKQLRRKLGENGRLLVQDKYDWKAIAEKLDGVYRRLINQTTD